MLGSGVDAAQALAHGRVMAVAVGAERPAAGMRQPFNPADQIRQPHPCHCRTLAAHGNAGADGACLAQCFGQGGQLVHQHTHPGMVGAGAAQAGFANGAQPVQHQGNQLGVLVNAVGGVQALQRAAQLLPVVAKLLPLRLGQHVGGAQMAIGQLGQGVNQPVGVFTFARQPGGDACITVQAHAGQAAMALQVHHQLLQRLAPLHAFMAALTLPALAVPAAAQCGDSAQQGHAGNR